MDWEPLPEGARSGWYADPSGEKKARYWDGLTWTTNARNDVPVDPTPNAADLQRERELDARARQEADRWQRVAVTTSHELPHGRIEKHVGEVFGITVRTRNAFSNAIAGVRGVVGGEVSSYTKLMLTARAEAIDRLRQEAARIGANAVISMRCDASQISDLMTEFVAYGAAVIITSDGDNHEARP
jgi:uncharacterized protein YbjQ (UPF0145 family)